jgi:hypothetical protein
MKATDHACIKPLQESYEKSIKDLGDFKTVQHAPGLHFAYA